MIGTSVLEKSEDKKRFCFCPKGLPFLGSAKFIERLVTQAKTSGGKNLLSHGVVIEHVLGYFNNVGAGRIERNLSALLIILDLIDFSIEVLKTLVFDILVLHL